MEESGGFNFWSFIPEERASGIQWIGGCVRPCVGLDDVA